MERGDGTVVLSYEEYERIKNQVLSKRNQNDEDEERRKKAKEKSEALARSMMALDEQRRLLHLKGAQWSLQGVEEQRRAQDMITKAQLGKQEENQDIRNLNQVILQAKCRTIRDRQVAEKRQTEREIADVESALDTMMEDERRENLLKDEEEKQEQRRRRCRQAAEIRDQVEEKLQKREEEREWKLQEAEKFNQDLDSFFNARGVSATERAQKKQAEMHTLMEENEKIIFSKKHEKELEKLETLKIMDELKTKAEEEGKMEDERKGRRKEEMLKLRDFQKQQHLNKKEHERIGRPLTFEADEDFHLEEKAEREWRKRELEKLQRRREAENQMQAERKEQVELKAKQRALEALREKRDFQARLQLLQEAQEKDAQKTLQQKKAALKCAQEVREQVEERARQRQERDRKERDEDQAFLRHYREQEEQARRLRQQKLDDLRSKGIPESYIADVQRKAEKPPKLMFHK